MKKILIFLCIISSSFGFLACRSVKQASALQDCTYSFTSISNLKIGDVNLQGKQSFKDLGANETGLLSQLLMAKKLPISLTANVSITNPNTKIAALNALDWILVIRDKDVANGSVQQRIEIKPNQTVTVPITINTDASAVFKAFSMKELSQLMFNISSVSGIPIEAKLKIKPSISVGKKSIKSPAYFTIDVPKL